MKDMARLKAVVRDGHVVSDERVDLPEGTPIEIEVLGIEDELDTEEFARLDEVVARSRADIAAGRTSTAEELFRSLRSGR